MYHEAIKAAKNVQLIDSLYRSVKMKRGCGAALKFAVQGDYVDLVKMVLADISYTVLVSDLVASGVTLKYAVEKGFIKLVELIANASGHSPPSDAVLLALLKEATSNPPMRQMLLNLVKKKKGSVGSIKFAVQNNLLDLLQSIMNDKSFSPTSAELVAAGVTLQYAVEKGLCMLVQVSRGACKDQCPCSSKEDYFDFKSYWRSHGPSIRNRGNFLFDHIFF